MARYSSCQASADQTNNSTAPVLTSTQPSNTSSVSACQAPFSILASAGGSSDTMCTATRPRAPLGWTIHSGSMKASGARCATANHGGGPELSPTTMSASTDSPSSVSQECWRSSPSVSATLTASAT